MQVTPQNLDAAVERHLNDGNTPEQTLAWLTGQGVPEEKATAAIRRSYGRRTLEAARTEAMRRANRRLLYGVVIFVVGAAITVGTYVAADVGDSFVMAWGALLVGVFAMGQGLWYRSRVVRAADKAMAELD